MTEIGFNAEQYIEEQSKYILERINCGNIKKDLKLSDRVYRCACGNMIDRDFQASINLKTYGEKFAG